MSFFYFKKERIRHCSCRILLSLIVMLFALYNSQAVNAQDNWVQLCSEKNFCFLHPAALKVVPVKVVDSIVGQLRGDDVNLIYELGWYSPSYSRLAARSMVEKTIVDGLAADILMTDNIVVLRIPKIKPSSEFGMNSRFAMKLEFTGAVSIEMAREIFNSITFYPPSNK